MITIIKSVRELYNKLTDKSPDYMRGFYDCITYFIIGFEKSEQLNLYLIIRDLKNDNALLRSTIYKLKKNKSIVTDDNVNDKLSNYQVVIKEQSDRIERQKVELKRLHASMYVSVNQKVL